MFGGEAREEPTQHEGVKRGSQGAVPEKRRVSIRPPHVVVMACTSLAALAIVACSTGWETPSPVGTVAQGVTLPVPTTPPNPSWGLLEGVVPMKGMYFFPGSWGEDGPYEDQDSYVPLDELGNRTWKEDATARARTTALMASAGVNVINLSYMWHGDRWCEDYCDKIWDSVANYPVKVVPTLDGTGGNEHVINDYGKNTHLADGIWSAVEQYLINENHGDKWQRMYNRNGELRYAVGLIDVAATGITDDDFVAVLDAMADDIHSRALARNVPNVQIGFLIDPGTHGCPAPGTYWPQPGKTHFEKAKSFLAIMGWRNEWQTPQVPYCNRTGGCDNNVERLPTDLPTCPGVTPLPTAPTETYADANARSKRIRSQDWAKYVPTILDVSVGYDGHKTWPVIFNDPNVPWGTIGDSAFGYNDTWRNYMSEMKGIGNVGVTTVSWNSFTEGMAVVPGRRMINTSEIDDGFRDTLRYDWLRETYATDPRVCDHWHYVNGQPTHHISGPICTYWQNLGGQVGRDPAHRYGEPVSSVVTSPGGNLVARFGLYPPADFFGFYVKTGQAVHEVQGAIYAHYKSMNEDASYLGAPTSDELQRNTFCLDGKYNTFEHGVIDWCPDGSVWDHSADAAAYPGHTVGPGEIRGYPYGSKCISVAYGAPQGTGLTTWDCVNGANEQWVFDPVAHSIRSSYDASWCLDIFAYNTNDGASVVAWPCDGQLNQQWDYDNGAYRSRMIAPTPKCLTASYAGANGDPLVSWQCSGYTNQQFTLP